MDKSCLFTIVLFKLHPIPCCVPVWLRVVVIVSNNQHPGLQAGWLAQADTRDGILSFCVWSFVCFDGAGVYLIVITGNKL